MEARYAEFRTICVRCWRRGLEKVKTGYTVRREGNP